MAGIYKFSYQIASGFCICCFVIGQLGIKQAEAIVMLCSKNCIFHSRFFRQANPLFRVIIYRIKLFKILVIFFCCHFFF